jgi:hypothetical protein
MLASRIGWTCWALLPVAGLAYHFGPGQRAYTEDRARDVIGQAQRLEADAQDAQDAAYQAHLLSLKARKTALASKAAPDEAAARDAATREDEAYRIAAEKWKLTADKLQQAQDMLGAAGSAKTDPVRVARDRALIRAGKIAEGVGDLENMLDTMSEAGQQETALARKAREEVATGYYYGARLMRVAGKPAAEWRAVSGAARQNFRYLAETSTDGGAESKTGELQKNLELVLNLEQSGQEDLLAKPLPKNSPRGSAEGLGPGKKQGKSKRPPRKGPDARGASGVGDIEGGW